MATTFTKFDQLGAVLAELSFRSVSLHMSRREDETVYSTVYLHGDAGCVQGAGESPTQALQDALVNMARKEADRIEAVATQVAA